MKQLSSTLLAITVLFLSSFFFLMTSETFAQSSPIDLSVSPPTKYVHVMPGKSLTHTVVIEQHGSSPLKITPSIVDFKSDGKTGQPVLDFDKGTTFRYLKIQNPDVKIGQPFELNPGQKKQIVFVIEPSSEAVQGEFPLTLLFTAQPNAEITIGTGTQVSGIVGSNLIVLISTSETDKGTLLLEKIQVPRLVDSFGSLTFSLLAKNDGRNATTASGSATITNWQKEIVAEYTLYPDMILAQTTRLLRQGESIEEDDSAHISSEFKYKPVFLLGPYTVTATLNDSEMRTQVFAFPFSLVVLIVIGILLYGAYKYLVKVH